MLVKVLEFDTIDLKQAERKLVEYLNDGWEIKGQSESGDGFIHYTLVYGKPNVVDVLRHHAYGVVAN